MHSWGRSVNISIFDPSVIGIIEGELTGNNTTSVSSALLLDRIFCDPSVHVHG